MKLPFLLPFLFLSITIFPTIASGIPKIPAEPEGYDGFSPADVKINPLILSTFISQVPNFVIKAINGRKMAPSSYGVIMRYAFRAPIHNGYEIIYYVKAHEPGNDDGKDYYAHFTVTVGSYGSNKKFVEYVMDAALPHSK